MTQKSLVTRLVLQKLSKTFAVYSPEIQTGDITTIGNFYVSKEKLTTEFGGVPSKITVKITGVS